MAPYIIVASALLLGYALGLCSRLVVKATLKDYVHDKIADLNNVTTTYTQKVQIECDKMVEDARSQAIAIYKEALNEASKVVLFDNTNDLN